MDRCETCKHWRESDEWDVKAGSLRTCDRVRPKWVVEDEVPNEVREGKWGWDGDDDPITAKYIAASEAVFAKAVAVVNDGSQYRAELLTRANFGCVLHER